MPDTKSGQVCHMAPVCWPKPDQYEEIAILSAERDGCDYMVAGPWRRCGDRLCTHRWRHWALCEEHAKGKYHPTRRGIHRLLDKEPA